MKSLSRVGSASAVLTAVWTVWFTVAFFAWYAVSPPGEWHGLEAYATSFQPGPFLAWVIPCVLLTLTFPVLMACIYLYAPEDRKVWGLLGLVFAVVYAAILGLNYWVMQSVVSPGLSGNHLEGLDLFVIGGPVSIAFSLEGYGYFLMGLSMLFAGFVFSGGRLERWIRGLLLVNGIQVLAVVAGMFGIWIITMLSLVVWCISFPLVSILLAVLFHRQADAKELSSV